LHPAGVLPISICILQEFRPAGAERQQYELPAQLINLCLMDGFVFSPGGALRSFGTKTQQYELPVQLIKLCLMDGFVFSPGGA